MQARIQAQCEIGIIGLIIKLSGLRLAATIADLWRGGRGGEGESGSRHSREQGGGGGEQRAGAAKNTART
jgi:hypothetical protein